MFAFPELRHVALTTTLITGFAAALAAQGTTGVAGINDYTIGGSIPVSTSCNSLSFLGGGPTPFQVDVGAPGAPVLLLFSLHCTCSPCFFPLTPATCPIPFTACTIPGTIIGTTNQSLDINTGAPCLFLNAPLTANAAGFATINLNLPPALTFGTQAATINACSTFPILFTQAYTVQT